MAEDLNPWWILWGHGTLQRFEATLWFHQTWLAENPLNRGSNARNITYFHGPFSNTPCLITPECSVKYPSVRTYDMMQAWWRNPHRASFIGTPLARLSHDELEVTRIAVSGSLPSGNETVCYWKFLLMMNFPMTKIVIVHSLFGYVYQRVADDFPARKTCSISGRKIYPANPLNV